MESRNYIQCLTTLGAGGKNGLQQLHYLGKKNSELQALKKDAFTWSVGENRTITY